MKNERDEGAGLKSDKIKMTTSSTTTTTTTTTSALTTTAITTQFKLITKPKLLEVRQNPNYLQDYCCRFGWYTIGGVHLPYVLRGDEKYFSKRMIEMKLLNSSCYLTVLHQEMYDIACIASSYTKKSEARLWNEINFCHCDSQFGSQAFSECDTMIKLNDLVNYYDFLLFCYGKLMTQTSLMPERCGFISINKQAAVPYTVHKGKTYVPLFYFEGDVGGLKSKTLILGGWDLSYLKFCFKVQEIRRELYQIGLCEVLDLNDAKLSFQAGSTFEKFWPDESRLKNVLMVSPEAAMPKLMPHTVNQQQQPQQPQYQQRVQQQQPQYQQRVQPQLQYQQQIQQQQPQHQQQVFKPTTQFTLDHRPHLKPYFKNISVQFKKK